MIDPNLSAEIEVTDGDALDGTEPRTAWVEASLHLGEIWYVRRWRDFASGATRDDACLIEHYDGATLRVRMPFEDLAERVERWRSHAALFGIVG